MTNEAQLIKALNRLASAIENFTDMYRRLNDAIYENDIEAAAALHVSRGFFHTYYAQQIGDKQGNSRTYLKSDLMERKEQVRMESTGRHYGDD
ncbi:hypothetical protein KIH79_02210 [Bifidobacterium sp. 82T10]|uniref:Uncharacterized protein n=1 Tax=Bifidobacterium miconis TaxID=2834435 RepID=A0ABS6WD53_9BIFI|nr:hypothetical protein [Bifidobacterium miconis]MBW3091782.1 hypothetical protein [Bifidobacterium miconis]